MEKEEEEREEEMEKNNTRKWRRKVRGRSGIKEWRGWSSLIKEFSLGCE